MNFDQSGFTKRKELAPEKKLSRDASSTVPPIHSTASRSLQYEFSHVIEHVHDRYHIDTRTHVYVHVRMLLSRTCVIADRIGSVPLCHAAGS